MENKTHFTFKRFNFVEVLLVIIGVLGLIAITYDIAHVNKPGEFKPTIINEGRKDSLTLPPAR